jgi:hypothetical protein
MRGGELSFPSSGLGTHLSAKLCFGRIKNSAHTVRQSAEEPEMTVPYAALD